MAKIVETKTDEAGRAYDVYDDGTEKYCHGGPFRKGPTEQLITTSEQGRALVKRRMERARERAIEGIDEAAIAAGKLDRSQASGGEGWKVVVEHVARTLLKSENLRGQAEAANFLGKSAGYTVEDRNEIPPLAAVMIVATEETAAALEALSEIRRRQQMIASPEPVIDVSANDGAMENLRALQEIRDRQAKE